MDSFSSVVIKAQLKLSIQDEVSQTLTILGESYRRKCLWKSDDYRKSEFVEKMVIKEGYIFYHTNTADIRSIDEHARIMSGTEFHAPSYLDSITLSYPEPQFLTLGEIVVKTEHKYKHFMVAEHITKKIYFIASDTLGKGGSLYAADISKGATEVVAEKVDNVGNGSKLTALVVDQITGDIILAGYTDHPTDSYYNQTFIESLNKTSYSSEMLTFAGVSTSKENVDDKQELDKYIS